MEIITTKAKIYSFVIGSNTYKVTTVDGSILQVIYRGNIVPDKNIPSHSEALMAVANGFLSYNGPKRSVLGETREVLRKNPDVVGLVRGYLLGRNSWALAYTALTEIKLFATEMGIGYVCLSTLNDKSAPYVTVEGRKL